jgi:hypothetical protein
MQKTSLTENVLAKKSRFSNEMKPAPLIMHKIYLLEHYKTVYEGNSILFIYSFFIVMNLKSVDGSRPCQPISFHWSEIRPSSS